MENRFTISETGSTSSSGIGVRTPLRNVKRPRRVASCFACSLIRSVYCLKTSYRPSRVAC